MKIYLIRHGVTESNEKNIRQSKDGDLSIMGVEQATLLSEKLAHLSLERILTSPFPRARQTADYIAKSHQGVTVEDTEFLVEVRYPSEIVGKSKNDPQSVAILNDVHANLGRPDWRHSDEETFDEFTSRAHAALKHVADGGKDADTLLVSHERFIRVLVSVVLLGKEYSPSVFRVVRENLYVSNTGVTILEKNTQGGGEWQLMTLNDHSHLTEVAKQEG